MSVLPSPIPHPLDYTPWDVPGWIYNALDWVVGVQWPEGNERAVWDVADQWYAVASVLAGPHADAAAAAVEVHSGYGGVGAVDAAFEAAWRGIAEGAEAPLPVLLAVTADLGRLVEECGCDIEGAKLEVWIELGILVVELLSVAVVAVLTAGAATPAAGAAITATRLLVQQIFKRLMGQLASKSLKHGLKEAGERAAKEVARGGVRGLAKRAAREGAEEAAEEAGVTLATQAYQNSTGRAHGLDLTDLGASAVGGLAGGAVAPLAGLGRHATGRAARVGEHLGREMTGEVLAESAASLATGQGMTSVEDVARAAASGATGSATGQTDHALRARLDAQANALTGAPLAGPSLPSVAPLAGDSASSASASTGAAFTAASPPVAASVAAADDVVLSPVVPMQAAAVATSSPDQVVVLLPPTNDSNVNGPSPLPVGALSDADVAERSLRPSESMPSTDGPLTERAGTAHPVAADPTLPPVAADPTLSSVAADPTHSSAGTDPRLSSVAADPTLSSVAAPVAGTLEPTSGPATGVTPGQHAATSAPTAWSPSTATPAPTTTPGPTVPVTFAAPTATNGPLPGTNTAPAVGRYAVPARVPTPETLAPVRAPAHPARGRASIPVDVAAFGDPSVPTPDTDAWYAAQWAAEAEAAERRRYQGHYESQRTGFENSRRQAEAARMRARAAEHDRRAVEYSAYARQLHQAGHRQWADGWQRAANDETRAYGQWRDLADAVLAGTTAPLVVDIGAATFEHANRDVGALALGAVETTGPSRLTGDADPPPIDDSRPYGRPGGLRPPLALHQVDVERQMPRESDGTVTRTADPRQGGWFRLLNDGGPAADATRGINCLDCTLSLFETWVHGRPRVSAPRTFDGYLDGDIQRPIRGEAGGPGRVEDVTGGRFQQLLAPPSDQRPHAEQARQAADRGFRNLHDQLLLGGHGSYAFLVTEWPHGGSHAWVALNQNGTVLYVDPQNGVVRDRPLYPDVVGIDALVLSGDGRPMPLGGLPRGRFSERPDLPDHPPTEDDSGHGDPYINRMYLLLDGPGSAPSSQDADPAETSSGVARDQPSPSGGPARVVSVAGSLDEIFAAGVSPVEFATAIDPPALRRLVPDLDEASARDVARLFADVRVRDMLDRARREPPANEPELAESLARQLVRHPDLARLILSTPELANSLTARPLTLYHLASHQQAIDVLAEVLDDVAQQEALGQGGARRQVPQPEPTLLTDEQLRISASIQVRRGPVAQAGFDGVRRDDAAYRRCYLDNLYSAALEAQADLNQLAVSLANVDGLRVGEPGWRPQPKDRRRAEDKVNKYQGDASKLLDLAAAKVEFRCLDDLYAALGRIRDHPDVVIVSCQDRFMSPEDSGYRDVQLVLRTRNEHLAEFRLHLAALDAIAVWEHALYEVRRDVDALARIEGRALTRREGAIADGILRREQQLFWQALQSTYEGNA
ncbi:toxin glutamine deamidase domain-containing protein [Micromonospora sp. LH3U1]|uniref:toxin glutamine deamidase domain-containing protein n=1 Tax=Micromonospora sp. LH3U1 TaxID=3018339 RepID=UPI00234AB0AF|nr:toxin glutamine deamidase domain-containing protein [Micromonospora sp. LH3U1]WCN82440.1 toxin glutamine deamidase domain-containing protein [Micromonospora sp. LH3U1]